MQNVRELVEEYIKAMHLPNPDAANKIKEICEFISKLNTKEINSNAEIVAILFCVAMSKLKDSYLNDGEIDSYIISAFKNIEMLDADANQCNLCTPILTIRFLKKLNQMVGNELDLRTIDEDMQTQFDELSENLEGMKSVFKVKTDDKEMFPIGKLLAGVIGNEKFKFDVLDVKTLNTLLLALQIFNTSEYSEVSDKLKKLIDDCDLKCLKYLENDSVKKFDENTWKINFQKNGVLVLADICRNTVLIRHEDKEYFRPLNPSEFSKVRDEKNNEGKRIASYYEYEYEAGLVFDSLEGLLLSKNPKQVINTLRVIFNKKNYNVFYQNAFFKKNDEVILVNPFTSSDTTIVIGDREEHTFVATALNVTNECLNRYWLEILFGENMNNVTIGLLCYLMTIENVDIDLICKGLTPSSFYQNQIINNWIMASSNPLDSLNKIQNSFFQKLKYIQANNDLKNQSFSGLFLYPFRLAVNMIHNIFLNEYKSFHPADVEFIRANIIINFDGKMEGINCNGVEVKKEDIMYSEDEEYVNNELIYVVKEPKGKWILSKVIDDLGKIHSKIENENKSLLSFEQISIFNEIQIQQVKEYMELHKQALLDQKSVKICFESMVKFRLIHNLVRYKILTEEKWKNFLGILGCHQKISYEFVNGHILLDQKGVLFVPKEKQESDSVLTSICNEYLRKHNSRNVDLYNNEIEFTDGKYCLRGNIIEKVVFLFDTLQNGSSTQRTLSCYFENYGEKTVGRLPNRAQLYYVDKEPIELKTIISTNSAAVEICFMYGAKVGEENIKSYCNEVGKGHDDLNNASVNCLNTIRKVVEDQLIEMCRTIYGVCEMRKNEYPIIREFNQPKHNVFPEDMLKSECVFSLFVKKKEFPF